jgi:TRAP-type C4-dicarboxylate transport system substrate-binding protein
MKKLVTSVCGAVIVSALTLVAVGAGNSRAGPPQKTGSIVTLTLGATQGRGRPSTGIAEAFAARVRALSKGTMVVKIAYKSGVGEDTPVGRQEANLVALVRTAKVQLAIVATRAFDFQGVTSFQALQTPFLITTEAAMDRATAGRIAVQAQSGLPKIGLTALGLAPEGLRRPFGFRKVLASPGDFAGKRFGASPTETLRSLLRALGATPIDYDDRVVEKGVENGTIAGADSTLALAGDGGLPRLGVTAGNLALFPMVDALVANTSKLTKLSSAQVEVLRTAAASARGWAIANLTERNGRNAYCRGGGTIVTAPSASIAALKAKSVSVAAAMRANPLTRRLITEIGGFVTAGVTEAPCSHAAGGAAATGPTVDEVIPAGVYRKTVTEKQLLAAGASPDGAKTNGGAWTMTVTADGYQQIHVDSPYPEYTHTCEKRKMYIATTTSPRPARRGLVAIDFRGKGCGGGFGVAWKFVPGGIEFTRVSAPDPVLLSLWSGVFWKRIA